MSNRLRQAAAGALLTAVLPLTGCAAINPFAERANHTADNYAAPLSADDKLRFRKVFDVISRYWEQGGVTGDTLELYFIEHGYTYNCPNEGDPFSIEPSNPYDILYCPDTDDVVISQAGVQMVKGLAKDMQERPENRNSSVNLEDAAAKIVMAHEISHGVQRSRGITIHFLPQSMDVEALERQADCLAGQALAIVDPMTIPYAQAFFEQLDDLSIFGGWDADDRVASFARGASGAGC